jgi:hypothetical protein
MLQFPVSHEASASELAQEVEPASLDPSATFELQQSPITFWIEGCNQSHVDPNKILQNALFTKRQLDL